MQAHGKGFSVRSLSRPYDIAVTQSRRIVGALAMLHAAHASMYFFSLHTGPWLCAAALLCLPCGAAHADVYSFVAENGSSHFSDSPDDPRYKLLLRVAADAPAAADTGAGTGPAMHAGQRYDSAIAAAARSSHVEAALLHAVIAVESNYNPQAVSRKGALGLMQLMPATARSLGVSEPLNAVQNIRGGAQHLRALLDRFDNDKTLALAAYNAGVGAVLASGGHIPPFAQTRAYVPAVLRHYQQNMARLAGAVD